MHLFIDEIGCEPSQTELDFRVRETVSCQKLQDWWNACFDKEDFDHCATISNCPATCKIARGECPGNFFSPFILFSADDV